MAVVFEGFSIREYASKMRSIDVVKCWPFSSTVAAAAAADADDDDGSNSNKISKQSMESLLPPITVTKFRWWSHSKDELDLLKPTEYLASNRQSNSDMVINNRNNKVQETQPRNQSVCLQVNLRIGEKSDEKMIDTLKCPVCGVFGASTVNDHICHKMRMSINKATKSKTPKKRSINQIFAAAPQIHKVDDNFLDEAENGSLEELNCENIDQREPNWKKKKVAIVKKLMNKKRKLKNNHQDDLIANKENGRRLKLQTPVNFNIKPNSTLCGRGSKTVSILRKKPSLRCLSAKKKSKVIQASKLIVEHERPSSLVNGILRNPSKRISRQNAAMCSLKATTQASTCGVQHSVRHVSFSGGKDDILGPCKKHVTSFEKSICRLDLDSFELSKEGHQNEDDKEFPARETNRNDEDVSFSTENGSRVGAMVEKRLPDIDHTVDRTKFLGPHIIEQGKANHFSDRSLAPGQVVLDSGKVHKSNQGNQTAFHTTPYTVLAGLFSSVEEIRNPYVNSQVCSGASAALNYSSPLVDYFGDHTQEVAIDSKINPRASLQPSSSGFALSKNANATDPFTSQFASENISGHAVSRQTLYRLSPSELMGRLCPFPKWKPKEVSFKEKYRDKEIYGLPLNSQGELVQGKPSGKIGFNRLKKPSPASGSSCSMNYLFMPRSIDDDSIMKGKDFTESASFNNQLGLFHAQNRMKADATVHSLAKLGATELQGRKNDDYCIYSDSKCNSYLMDPDLNSMDISFSGCRQYDQFQNQKEKGMGHAKENAKKILLNGPLQTMRLMGKDVTICRNSGERQGIANGKVWTDRNHPQSTALQNSRVDRHYKQDCILDPASGKFKKTPVQQFEVKSNQAFPGNVHMKPLESTFFQPGLNRQANKEFHNSSLTIAGNPNPNAYHFTHPPTSHAVFDNGADFLESFLSRDETSRVSFQLPRESASHRNCQLINGNSVELKAKKNLWNAGKSSFNFPFLHSDHVEYVQPSWLWGSSNLTPWQQVKAPSTPSQPFPEVGGSHHPYTGTSFLPNRLVPDHLPIVSCDHNPVISYSHMESSVGQPSMAHSQFIPALAGIKPTTSVNLSQWNRIKVKERMRSRNVGIRDHGIFQKKRKRHGAEEDYIPNLGIQYESRAATRSTRENFFDDIQCNTRSSLETEPGRNEAKPCGMDSK